MSERTAFSPGFDVSEGLDSSYRAMHPLAVVSAVLGLVSLIALAHPAMLIVPILAIVSGLLAWRAISQNADTWAGGKVAMFGIALAVFFAAAGAARFSSRQSRLVTEADAIALEFCGYLARDEAYKAHQMVMEPIKRLPLDDHLPNFYRNSTKLNGQIRAWSKTPSIRSLLFLGPSAQVRPYQTESQSNFKGSDTLQRIYVVTFNQEGQRRSFFLRMTLSRVVDEDTGQVGWLVGEVRAPVTPEGWPGAEPKKQK